MQAAAPPALKIDLLADQSRFVEAALNGVVRESLIAAALTAAFIFSVSRQLAQHSHRDNLNPAQRPCVAQLAQRPRLYLERDDLGRLGRCDWHPGG
jgi:hypothetical protein